MDDEDLDIDRLRQWIGRSETQRDTVVPVPVRALAATLDRAGAPAGPGDELPPLWHWLYFLPLAQQSEIGDDGHPRRGGFLPPVPLPRRMWAGSRLEFVAPLRVGDAIERRSRIADVRLRTGRSGPLVFVVVRHEIAGREGPAIVEEHDIVYRGAAAPGAVAAAPPAPPHQWIHEIRADPVLLFRYSALTFNGHRIHYDRRYVTEVEGYPGLVVHGPLIATLLLEGLRRERPQARVRQFRFRAVSPVFDSEPLFVCGRDADGDAELWARHADGTLAMDALATLA